MAQTVKETRDKVRLELALRDPTRAKFWKLMKRSPDCKRDIIALKDPSGEIKFKTEEIGDIIYNSFAKRLNGGRTKTRRKKHKRKYLDLYGKRLTQELKPEEYDKVISQIKNNKAVGPFGIKGELIKNGGFTLRSYMIIWINKMLRNGKVPMTLKAGRVKLIYKKGSSFNPLNYRPITISSVLLKVLTRLLNMRLMNLVEEKSLLSDKQFGFRKERSTQDAILVVATAIEKAKADGDDAALAFIDLKAAYDKVLLVMFIPYK